MASVVKDVSAASRELADIADRIGWFDAAKKLREYGAAVDRGANIGDQTAKAVLAAKAAYDQSATKRLIGALSGLVDTVNKKKSPLLRIRTARTARVATPGDMG